MHKREYARNIKMAIRAAELHAIDNVANIHIPTAGQRGAVIGILNRITGGDDNRKLLLGWLFVDDGMVFERTSTKSLTDTQWAALYAWCDFRKDEDRVIWVPKETFTQECLACLSAALDDYMDLSYQDREDMSGDLVANILNYGEGEVTDTGVKAGVKGEDKIFDRDKDLPSLETPPSPYIRAVKDVFKTKPKLYNPFD